MRLHKANLPLFTLSAVALAFIGQLPGLAELLQYERTAIASGELWRLLTCHFCHWSRDHFLWCGLVLLGLGSLLEQYQRRALLSCLLAGSLAISAAICWWQPELTSYRGLSGLGSAIFVCTSCWLLTQRWQAKQYGPGLALAVGLLLFVAKVVYEWLTGQAIFVESNQLFIPLPLAHLVGGMVGLCTFLCFWPRSALHCRNELSSPLSG